MIGEIEEFIRDMCQALEAEIEDANFDQDRALQIMSWHWKQFYAARMRMKDYKDDAEIAQSFKKGWQSAVQIMMQSWKDYGAQLAGDLITYQVWGI